MKCSIREPLLLMGVPARPKGFSKKLVLPPLAKQLNLCILYLSAAELRTWAREGTLLDNLVVREEMLPLRRSWSARECLKKSL